jgi:virulence factor Mce-like protein
MKPFAAGLVLIVGIVVLTYLGFTKSIPFRHHYTIHAAFASSNNITKNSPIRIAGVNVGKVTGVTHIGGGGQGAVVDMRIDNTGLPIHNDARVTVRPRIFLEGNFFLDLQPGSPSAPVVGDGGTIPVQQTAAPVQLDQVLSVLKTSTRTDLQHILAELSKSFSGRGGAGFNRSIQFWGPAYRDSAIVSDATLGTQQHDLSNYLNHAGAVAAALDAEPPALRGLITNFNATVTPLAQENQALGAAVAELPRTLHVGIPALATLNAAFPALRRLVAELRPAVRSSTPAVTNGIPFAQQAASLLSRPELRGLLDALRPAVPALTQLNIQSLPLLDQVRYASQCQNSVILPWSQQTVQEANFPDKNTDGSNSPVYQQFEKGLVGLGGDSREGDANGLWFRVLVAAGNFAFPSGNGQLTLSNFPIAGSNPVKPAGKPPFQPTVPCETQQPPNLASTPGGPPLGEMPAANPVGALGRSLYAKGEAALISQLQNDLKVQGLSNLLKVTTKPITSALLPQLRKLGTVGR